MELLHVAKHLEQKKTKITEKEEGQKHLQSRAFTYSRPRGPKYQEEEEGNRY
jgi:hypothetical protein